MALNPRIMAVPPQATDRAEHIHRFLTSLPKLGSPSTRDSPTTKLDMHDDRQGAEEGVDGSRQGGLPGMLTYYA